MKILAVLALSTIGCISASAVEITGYISDEKCAAGASKAKAAADWIDPKQFEQCAKRCVKAGSAVVFVTEDNKILKIDADSMTKVTPHIGHKVSVTGAIEGNSLKVESINALKM